MSLSLIAARVLKSSHRHVNSNSHRLGSGVLLQIKPEVCWQPVCPEKNRLDFSPVCPFFSGPIPPGGAGLLPSHLYGNRWFCVTSWVTLLSILSIGGTQGTTKDVNFHCHVAGILWAPIVYKITNAFCLSQVNH